ncbi:MAG TPA: peptidoglycan DD-metalloendopeptidase family protein [Candidatus Eremiobacteraceae bacterium]|nr:peptidoglycan DD-metalloendopeptidase family protein [Candidatus Eremiobacteraceae bacterium]
MTRHRSIAALALFAAVVLGTLMPWSRALAAQPTPMPLEARIKLKQAQIESTRRKLEASRAKLHQARFKVLTISQQLDDTNASIARVTAELGGVRVTIENTRKRLAVRKRQLAQVESSLDRHRDALNRRLVDVYEYGPTSYLEALLDSTSFVDFVERWDFIHYIVRADGDLITVINRDAWAYENVVAALQSTENQLLAQQDAEGRENDELGALATERGRLLVAAQSQRDIAAQQVLQLENLTAAQEARLQELIVEKQREDQLAVERAKMAACQARRAAAAAAGLTAPPCVPQLGGPVHFAWPVRGPITSPFGMRTDPISGAWELHTGIDIGADYGTPIEASADGEVIFAGWYGGYGYAIIIDHGSDYSTLYAHCSSIYVNTNQPVRQGQVIGAVGATGWATGPHLHFEIRYKGVPFDPLTKL